MISVVADRPSEPIHSANSRGSPVKPMASARKAAPARIRAIMHEVRVAPSRLSTKERQVSEPCAAASTSEPTTPMAAASVAVARPTYIEPMTQTMSTRTGIRNRASRSRAAKPIGGSAGTCCGRSTAQPIT
jgi:hypothetical protein